ncbi:MAG: 50S ribosomal protein L3 [Caldiserica bacterium]|nr:MAG: 50S ribosomal protein L3 [Caldisericota bacterium]
MRIGIIGKKLGMSQIFKENGAVIPVTVIEAKENYVVQIKKKDGKDGYSAVQIGYEEAKEKKLTKAELERLKKNNLPPLKILRELRMKDDKEVEEFKVGQKINVEIFKEGEFVDITGKSIGKGFQGVMKRHGFHGGPATHGSMSHRRPGSIGGTTPARVLKGKKMAGHMGNETVTIQNLEVVKVIPEKNLIMVKGAVPGHRNGYLLIRKALKKVAK